MDGIHDMGGMHGFGSTRSPGDGDAYHEPWEGRIFAIHLLVSSERLGGGPGGRATREEMDPAGYLEASYYERWLWSAERRLERGGSIEPGEVDAMTARLRAAETVPARTDDAAAMRALQALHEGDRLPMPSAPRYAPGDRVRVRRMRPAGHTRAPRYVRGATGVVDRVQGADRLPDLAVYGIHCEREPVYSVAFRSEDLWGEPPEGETPWTVLLDLWETYLEAAGD